jgi:hypothetical protein
MSGFRTQNYAGPIAEAQDRRTPNHDARSGAVLVGSAVARATDPRACVRLSDVPLRPLPETRVANTLPGLLLTAICVNVLLERSDVPTPLLWLGVVLGLGLAVRGYRMAVVVDEDRVTVRGLTWSRTVPAADVVTVSGGAVPLLRWRAASGRVRSSPVVAFMNAFGGMPRYTAHNHESLRLLRLAIGEARNR